MWFIFIKLGYDVSTDSNLRKQLWESVKNVSYEKVTNFVSEEVQKKYEKYSNSGQHVVDHELGIDAVSIASLATGGFLITGIKETGEKIGKNVVRDVNWVEVLDIKNKILAKKNHVLRMDINSKNTGFKGCHSKIALDDYVSNNPTAKYEFRDKIMDSSNNGVYEAKPIIIKQDGTEMIKLNNQGKSTFFPDEWNEAKILEEVEHAIQNNKGLVPKQNNISEYFGLSKDGKVEIHFYLTKDGKINSFFPVKK